MESSHNLRTSPETSEPRKLEDLITKNPLLQHAYAVAEKAHHEQKRDDGTPYIEHCISVVRILYEEWGITDPEVIAAGFLHDSVEDKGLSRADLIKEFGERIDSLVDGVTKFDSEKETHKKIVESNYLDPTVGVLKLADRLHNTRTLSTAHKDKRARKAIETLNIYTPLAESLGMWMVKTELEDLAFKYADPENYERYLKLYNDDLRTKKIFHSGMKTLLEAILKDEDIEGKVAIRENSLVRLKDKKHPFSDIEDVVSFRVVVGGKEADEKRDQCYKLLGILCDEFKDQEDPSRFDNFYNSPKSNKYSAIQITLNTPLGAVEIAITSDEKEDYNNWGVVSLIRKGETQLQKYALKIVMTPTGQAKFLPPKANGLDLAYLINKKLAAQAESIVIDGKNFPITTVIPNGADVEIKFGPDRIAPNRSDAEKSMPATKRKAEKQFLEQKMHDTENKGKEIVRKVISEAGLLELQDLDKIKEHSKKLDKLLNLSGSKRSLPTFYRLVKYGVINDAELRQLLKENYITKKDLGLTSILIEGKNRDDILSFFSKEIGKKKGDIRLNEGGSYDGKTFSERFVVENLTPSSEDEIRRVISFYPNVTNVVVV